MLELGFSDNVGNSMYQWEIALHSCLGYIPSCYLCDCREILQSHSFEWAVLYTTMNDSGFSSDICGCLLCDQEKKSASDWIQLKCTCYVIALFKCGYKFLSVQRSMGWQKLMWLYVAKNTFFHCSTLQFQFHLLFMQNWCGVMSKWPFILERWHYPGPFILCNDY
jgi:hypothetical protein